MEWQHTLDFCSDKSDLTNALCLVSSISSICEQNYVHLICKDECLLVLYESLNVSHDHPVYELLNLCGSFRAISSLSINISRLKKHRVLDVL